MNGLLTGMTGSFVVPGVMYLQAINLTSSELIQAMGTLFTVSKLALGQSLGQNDFLSTTNSTLSLLALVPASLGMVAGQNIRKRMSKKVSVKPSSFLYLYLAFTFFFESR